MITQAALQGLPWAPVLWGVFFAWLGWRLNIVGSFYKHAYDKRCVHACPPRPPG